ncbi:AfsR/SARP family transcriptional regulator [Stackebrandtia nassauensis]|uniref:Transcriptional regulator, SARP family n=1 Tax=Stackebrandtia nassauensis (strain DSM 44728 / CIP 108903 / NRRL B-16338 / NBRC 102104 / LLR-40K-21) TaxID=446470 RepID=D3PZV4_STANL|nr:AfsR/SARP family transcriptional regulator [Stackebrandtia nassauensis]ADD43641.1 transcriptional regulator, SARP family [Stackebrandtia nassauensis DSM 44728]
MEFSILGPLRVQHGGRSVPISGRHAPKLLAVLLVDAGRLVTVTRLIETLWAEDPPATAKRQVQNVMAALRRALPEPDAIEATGNGYRLELESATVDLREFERLRSLARAAEPREALRYLREALRLWRGEALAGLTGSSIEAAAAKLNEARISAIEERVELELDLERRLDVVGELRELLVAHPFRQRLTGQLMRALWYAGSKSEALEVYRKLRKRLAEGLGLDPDAELARLHSAILRGEPETPAADRTTAAVRERTVPAQLPAAPSTFTGRRKQVVALDELLEQGRNTAVVSAIAGMGGAGKTALALYWGHRVRERFPDGQLYINLRGYDEAKPVAAIDALGRFLVALGQTSTTVPSDVDEAAALFRSLLSERRMLVILDNAREAAQVRPLLPGGAGNLAIVTSRDRLASLTALEGAEPIRLDTLSQTESLELLANIVGAGRLDTDPEAAHRIAELCGRLPLALRIAGASLAAQPDLALGEFTDVLGGPDRLRRLALDGDKLASVSNVLELSVAALDDTSRELLLKLAQILGDDFCHGLAVHLSELDETGAGRNLAALEAAHLIEQHIPSRYRIHDLTRDYMRQQGRRTFDDVRLHDIQTCFITWHYAVRREISVTEASNVVSAFNAWREHPEIWKLATMFSVFSGTEYKPTQLLQLAEWALVARKDGMDPMGNAYLLMEIAILYRAMGNRNLAVREAEKAIDVVHRAGLEDPDGRFRGNLALMYMEVGQYIQAETLMRDALRSARESGDAQNIKSCSSSLAAICRRLGKFADAETLLNGVIDNPELPTQPTLDITAKAQLGALYLDIGRLTEALTVLDEVHSLPPDVGGMRSRTFSRILRTEALCALGRYESARPELTDVLAVAVRMDLTGAVMLATIQLAHLHSDSGDQQAALRALDTLGPHHLNESDQKFAAEIARLRCITNTRLRRFAKAVTFGGYACDRYANMSYPLMHARSLAALANAYEGANNPAQTTACRAQAFDIFSRLGVPEADELRELLGPAP